MIFLLLLVGIGCLLIEFHIPGYGVFGVSGLLSLAGAAFIALGANVKAALIVTSVFTIGIFVVWFLIRVLPKTKLWRALTLPISSTTERGYQSNKSYSFLLGVEGIAYTVLRPAGTGRFGDQLIDVVSVGSFIKQGTPIKVVAVEGSRVVVRDLADLA